MIKTMSISPELLCRAVESADDGIYITDPTGRIVFANEAIRQITGHPVEEMIGSQTSIFRSGEMSREYYARLWNTVLSGRVWREIIVNRRANGELYEASQTITPIVGTCGEVEGMIAVQRDLTSVRVLEEELKKSQTEVERLLREKETLLEEVHHRVKNDVELVRSLLEIQAKSATSQEARDAIQLASQRVSVVSRSYQALQENASGDGMDVAFYLDSLAENWRQAILDSSATLSLDVEHRHLGSKYLVSVGIVCNEVVTNAAKYGAVRERFELRLSVKFEQEETGDDTFVVISASDNGPGYPISVVQGEDRGFGLRVIAALAAQYRGSLRLGNRQGAETQIRLRVR